MTLIKTYMYIHPVFDIYVEDTKVTCRLDWVDWASDPRFIPGLSENGDECLIPIYGFIHNDLSYSRPVYRATGSP